MKSQFDALCVKTIPVTFLLGILLIIGTSGRAQTGKSVNPSQNPEANVMSSSRLAALMLIKPKEMVRIKTRDARILEGEFRRSNTEQLYVERGGGELSIPLDEIDALFLQGRATQKGAILGAAVGGGGTLAFLATVVLLGGGDSSEGLDLLFYYGGAWMIGATVAGIFIGSGIGATLPRWHQLYPKPSDRHRRVPLIGAVSLSATVTTGGTEIDGSIGASANFLAITHPVFAVGPEAGYWMGVNRDKDVWYAGTIVRVSLPFEKVRPYGILGMGVYSLDLSEHDVGGSIGGGVRIDSRSEAMGVAGEIRRHAKFGNPDSFYTVTAGVEYRW